MDVEKLLEKVYRENVFRDSIKKRILSDIGKFMRQLSASLKEKDVLAEVFLGGSSAKGTFLKGSFDSDIFVRFDYAKYSHLTHRLSDILEPSINEVTSSKAKRIHGSRDYFQYCAKEYQKNIDFEIIPVLHIDDPTKALNVTDVSPLHVIWMESMLKDNHEMSKQIIITKLFLKSIRAYGAESYIRGFSGHDVDILMAYYGSFLKLVNQATGWNVKEVIDVEKHYSSKIDALGKLNASKISPLILIDPVQPERNAAASLSLEKFQKFRQKCREFLKDPSEDFFKEPEFSLEKLKQETGKEEKLVVFEVTPREGKTDVVGSKILKVFKQIKKFIKECHLEVGASDWFWDKKTSAYLFYRISLDSLENMQKGKTFVRMGPPIGKKDDVKHFCAMHKDNFVLNGRVYANVERKYRSLGQCIKAIKNDRYILERVTLIKVIS